MVEQLALPRVIGQSLSASADALAVTTSPEAWLQSARAASAEPVLRRATTWRAWSAAPRVQ